MSGRTTSNKWADRDALIAALHGPHNYLPTPFCANLDLDADGLRRNVAYHAEQDPRPTTVTVAGGYGEGWKLSVEEHAHAVAAAVAGARGRMPVMAGVIGGYQISLQQAANAQKAGADALLIFPPRGEHHRPEGYYEFYMGTLKSVSIATTILPSGCHDFWPGIITRLAELENMIGFFPPGGDIDYYVDVGKQVMAGVAKPLLWLGENEEPTVHCFPFGCNAYSTAGAAFVPEASWRFFEHGVAGETESMNQVLKKDIDPILAIRGLPSSDGLNTVKAAMEALGRAGGPTRPPGTAVSDADRRGVVEILRNHRETKDHLIADYQQV